MHLNSDGQPPLATVPIRPIDALTGVRIVAALWVVVFHVSGNYYTEFGAGVRTWLGPVLSHGDLGVDLFYILSGYVLVLNYGARMGGHFDLHSSLRFWWARLARIWPAYFVTLNLAALWHGWLHATNRFNPVVPADFSVMSYIRQSLLVVMWTEPDARRLTWNGAAWTVSVEAFAYLLFPAIILVVWRLALVLRGRALLMATLLAIAPLSLLIAAMDSLWAPWMWMMRILCGFIAGALLCAALPHLRSERLAPVAEVLAVVIPISIVVTMYAADRAGMGHIMGAFVIPQFVMLVGALAVARRGMAAVLASSPAVLGGKISYSVYLVHMPIIEVIWYLQNVNPVWVAGGAVSRWAFVAVPVVVTIAGYALWRWVEEPGRHVMRRMAVGRV